MRGAVVLFLSVLLPVFSSAALASMPDQQRLQQLADSQQWQHLLHYRLHPFTGRTMSQNDSPEFFLAADGKRNLLSELTADLKAFLHTGLADNESAQCRFPARYFWLKQQLPEVAFVDQPCPEFTTWRDELDAHYLTLIFPASHINSPSSMYGHTLVRLDREDESRSKLLAYSVNFAANADTTDNELVFTWKGLTGGYPGVVSVMPYYVKTNEYQHMEYRDVWEYRLNFSKAEVDQFVRHIWETDDTFFDYFFFDENCSYRLLALLDASSERADMTDDFVLTAVPVETIRALQKNNLVAYSEYRASAASDMEHKSSEAPVAVLNTARELVESGLAIETLLQPLPQQQQVQALELAHAYARYLAIKKKQANPVLRARTIALLSARAKRPVTAGFSEIPVPAYRDDEGHLSRRAGIRAGALSGDDQAEFVDLRFRAAYHDVLDLPQGFVPGSQIQMGKLDVRVWDDGDVQVQHFTVVDVLSLSHRTFFQRPVAWGVSGGLDRFNGREAELHGFIHVAFGRAWLNSAGRFYGLAETQLRADNQFDKGYQWSIGPRLGWLWQDRRLQAQLEANWQPLSLGDDTDRTQLSAQLGWRLGNNVQLRAEASRQWFEQDSAETAVNEVSAAVQWYF
ncbi:DUF4105 domain-containing protein [Oceanospirillaceae bacterium ASx5O]|nr:DUF4105 domain-containing protein [Oceanospirillaceae bacterium ASx5O]